MSVNPVSTQKRQMLLDIQSELTKITSGVLALQGLGVRATDRGFAPNGALEFTDEEVADTFAGHTVAELFAVFFSVAQIEKFARNDNTGQVGYHIAQFEKFTR